MSKQSNTVLKQLNSIQVYSCLVIRTTLQATIVNRNLVMLIHGNNLAWMAEGLGTILIPVKVKYRDKLTPLGVSQVTPIGLCKSLLLQ